MERETLLTILLLLLGGLAAQPLAPWPHRARSDQVPQLAERRAWLQLWLPIVPALVVAAGLCGWALQESDPVRDRFDHGMVVTACLPFGVIALRAALRAAWALVREPAELPICTAGLLRPRAVFSPFLARTLEECQIRAAWEHEQAHVRHRDPLRIWLAQIATDLQWPWPWARKRFHTWLEALEYARDDEARSRGVSGVDLAAAILVTARQSSSTRQPYGARRAAAGDATLLGDARLLQARIARLLAPSPDAGARRARPRLGDPRAAGVLAAMLAIACTLGAVYGEWILHALFLWTWTV